MAAKFKTVLRRWRLKHHLFQKEAADKLSVPVGTYIRWEQGRNTPRPQFAVTHIQQLMTTYDQQHGIRTDQCSSQVTT